MIRVNGAEREWHRGLTVAEMIGELGYNTEKPMVLVIIDSKTVPSSNWETVPVEDGADVRIENILKGG